MKLDVSDDFLEKMNQLAYESFGLIQGELEDTTELIHQLPDNEYRQLALDALGLCIVAVAEALTE